METAIPPRQFGYETENNAVNITDAANHQRAAEVFGSETNSSAALSGCGTGKGAGSADVRILCVRRRLFVRPWNFMFGC